VPKFRKSYFRIKLGWKHHIHIGEWRISFGRRTTNRKRQKHKR